MSLNATGEGLLPPPGEALGQSHEAEGVPAVGEPSPPAAVPLPALACANVRPAAPALRPVARIVRTRPPQWLPFDQLQTRARAASIVALTLGAVLLFVVLVVLVYSFWPRRGRPPPPPAPESPKKGELPGRGGGGGLEAPQEGCCACALQHSEQLRVVAVWSASPASPHFRAAQVAWPARPLTSLCPAPLRPPAAAPAEPPPRIPIIVVQPNDDCVLGDLEPSAHPTWKDDLEAGPQDDPDTSASEPPAGGAVQGGHLLPGAASGIRGAWGYAPGRAPAHKCVVVVSSP